MSVQKNQFIEREEGEPLAIHLFRNAEVIGADQDQRRRLRLAAALCERGSAMPRCTTDEGRQDRVQAGRLADAVMREMRATLSRTLDAQAQGAEVVAFNDAGAMRIRGRDGLLAALNAGSITATMAHDGLTYRGMFEVVHSEPLGSQLGRVDEPTVKASTSDAAVGRGFYRAWTGLAVTRIDQAVLAVDRTQRALHVLRAVAGEGQSIRSMGGGGKARAANAAALVVALRTIHPIVSSWGLRIGGH